MRPFVERAHKLPPGGPRLANPRTRAGVTAFSAVVKVLSTAPLRCLGDRLASRPADAIDLPDYAHLLQRRGFMAPARPTERCACRSAYVSLRHPAPPI